ncbi:YkgJ family cysteine cluster protein [Bdellovibrio sp. SKB1291214]|uniref:YkgJ family cysteine cluster protein n=1 Tax=Bdellovibrio sp. SKB1291214 TaxID=1732569 RepID=UPI000B51E5A8|nr:YkgJ family cysteine cluster protein [Bdellovibrio sp. SKB1291214]UYL09403.1 YkgJ family cysteine cluster protein [Bdellovibrio sp. SKB1291214]
MTFSEFLAQHPRLTRSFKNFVTEYETKLDAATFESFLNSLGTELSRIHSELSEISDDVLRARALHHLVEAEIESEKDIKISCRKGCSACCHMEVEITSYEAKILSQLVKEGHAIDRARLKRQSQRTLQDPQWKQGPRHADNPCVFLNGEGSCSIYEHRPVMCRRHSVTTPPKNCDTLDATITVRYFPKVDLYISAANQDQHMTIGPMAKMLEMELT